MEVENLQNIIQIALSHGYSHSAGTVVALCLDGSVWVKRAITDSKWSRINEGNKEYSVNK